MLGLSGLPLVLEKEEEEDEEEEEEEARYTNASIHVRFTKNVPTAKEQNVSNKTFLRNARARANGRMVWSYANGKARAHLRALVVVTLSRRVDGRCHPCH